MTPGALIVTQGVPMFIQQSETRCADVLQSHARSLIDHTEGTLMGNSSIRNYQGPAVLNIQFTYLLSRHENAKDTGGQR